MKYWAPALERKMCEYSLLINERKIENGNRNVPHCCMYYEVVWVDLGLPRCLCIFFNTAYPPFFFGVWEMITQTTSQLIQLKKNTTICFFSWTINNAKTFQFFFSNSASSAAQYLATSSWILAMRKESSDSFGTFKCHPMNNSQFVPLS